ncbi:Fic family protein [Pseudoxanthomonas koreensis]|uniref:Fic family protein n=1 Tax=Pseudoxanthomonas koreensis TaxID=266061 RepID=UPI0013911ACA|nr:Fic family protein [Pseudoxanthomonas koreensis]KAF1695307.1 cell filamentation protein Fic [Pseudoxanthomonas koreensis]
MPPRDLRAAIVQTVGQDPPGLGLEGLQRAFPDVARRTLQRHLADLVADGRLVAQGRARARIYRPAAAANHGAAGTGRTVPAIPLSSEGVEVRALVRRPIEQRTPVGYARGFLADYVPNRTAYLPGPLRQHLQRMGRSPVTDSYAGTYARQVLDRLLIDLSWSSSRLEGNTYNRLDTQNLIQFGHEAEGKDRLEAQMILNHKAAIEMLVDQAGGIGFNRYTVQNLHALLADNLLPDAAAGGRLRRIDVGITNSVFHPLAVPQQIEEYFDLLLDKATAIEDPFEQAFFVMVQLPYLQPFDDVNKRVSRLAANIPLIRQNLAPLSFVDVPRDEYIDGTLGIYELNRIELLRDVFTWAYERSCQRFTVIRDAMPEPDPLRLRYREVLQNAVGEIVAAGVRRGDADAIRRVVRPDVPQDDLNEVVALVINELHQLHEGNIARYRLRPSQFSDWLAAQGE